MADSELIIPRASYNNLKKQLQKEYERRDEIGEQLREARGFGDLSENAEYDAAREAQAQNAARIAELEHEINTAIVVDPTEVGDFVSVGTDVEIEDEHGKRMSVSIVSTTATDSVANKISNESPIGSALMGHYAGDKVQFMTPAGKVREYTVINVRPSLIEDDDE